MHGNDTIWRATLDLNKILLYADGSGNMHQIPQRKYFALVDGIIGGEGNGPMEPDPKHSGILISGTNPVYIDTVAATLMGFDYKKIPTVRQAYQSKGYPLADLSPANIRIRSNIPAYEKSIDSFSYRDTLQFKPHYGWVNHIGLIDSAPLSEERP